MTRPLPSMDSGRRLPAVAAALGLAAAWLIFHPEAARPFDFLDFGEFLPYVRRTSNYGEQVISIIQYNAERSGRANLVPVIAATLKWHLFGMWTPGWQLARAVVMAVLMWQTYLLALRVGASRVGAVAAASIYLFAPPAARGWIRITMGEPMGMVAVLALTLRAFSFQTTSRWKLDVALFGATSVFVILTKELMAPAMALPLAAALTHINGACRWPRFTRRNVVLVTVTGVASIAALAPLVVLFLKASSNALASQYGNATQSVGGIIAIWIATLVPFSLAQDPPSTVWALAFCAFLCLVGGGWWLGFRSRDARPLVPWLLGGILLFPLLGALAYAPWPAYEERYAFPYLVATSLLVGMAVTFLEQRSRLLNAGLVVGGCLVVALGVSGASAAALRSDAVQRTVDGVINAVVAARATDSVYMATAREIFPEWTGPGPSIARLASATDRPWAPTRDIRCSEIADHLRPTAGVAVVAFVSHCRGALVSRQIVATHFRRMDWSRWSLVPDSVRADVFSSLADIDSAAVSASGPTPTGSPQ